MSTQRTVTGTDPVTRYLRDLDARLVGPRRVRRGMVSEAGDHLSDAVDAYVRAGHEPLDSARMAVADFGSVDEVAPAFQTTLAVASARRTSWILIAILCVQPMLWDRGLMLGVDAGAAAPSGMLFTLLDHLVEYGGTLTVVAALACLFATGMGNRWHRAGRGIAKATALFALAVCLVLPLVSTALVLTVGATDVAMRFTYMTALLFLPLALAARSARNCLAAAA